jgi:hypothetical protein
LLGVRQKLDCLAELTSLGPAAHLGVAGGLAVAAWVMPVPGSAIIAGALAASLVRPATYTLIALARDPHPGRAAAAFAFLPFYVVWRVGIQLMSLTKLRQAPWVRTARHRAADAEVTASASPGSPPA